MKSLYIIPGATGEIGEWYLDELTSKKENVVGITSSPSKVNQRLRLADLLDEGSVKNLVEQLPLNDFSSIYMIHCIGSEKFEDYGFPLKGFNSNVLDKETYDSNFSTFKNISEALIGKLKDNQKLKIATLGSITDKYQVPYWNTYSRAKNDVREYMKYAITNENVFATMINVSSVNIKKEREGRPYANSQYWLGKDKLLTESIPEISIFSEKYKEKNIFEKLPGWNENFFTDNKIVYTRRMKEMYNINFK